MRNYGRTCTIQALRILTAHPVNDNTLSDTPCGAHYLEVLHRRPVLLAASLPLTIQDDDCAVLAVHFCNDCRTLPMSQDHNISALRLLPNSISALRLLLNVDGYTIRLIILLFVFLFLLHFVILLLLLLHLVLV